MKSSRRVHSLLTVLLLLLVATASVYAQANDTNPEPSPSTSAPPTPVPSPTTKKPTTPAPSSGESSGSSGSEPEDETPAPTTKKPSNEAATEATPAPTATSDIDVDRSNKAEYGTRAPTPSNETSTESNGESAASKVGSWLVPAVIGAVIIIAVVFMSLFVKNRRGGDDDDFNNTPRRTDLFFEHPRTNTNHVANVPVLGDPVQAAKENPVKDQSSMRTHAVGGAPHSPRANKALASPQSDGRLTSPGFGTYKQKPMEGSSVVF